MQSIRIVLVLLTLSLTCAAANASDLSYRSLGARDGELSIQGQPVLIRAVDFPELMDPDTDYATRFAQYVKASDAGFTSFRVPFNGFSADGKTIDPEYLKFFIERKEEVEGGWMPLVIDLFAAYPDATPQFRMNAVKAMAEAFKTRRASLYWIDAPDSAILVEAFHAIGQRLVTVAPEGGDLTLQSAGASPVPGAFQIGAYPKDRHDPIHTLVPHDNDAYAKHETLVARENEGAGLPTHGHGLTPEEKAEGWISLFDGKTLDGWTIMGNNQDGFAVEDGAIRWKAPGGRVLLSAQRFTDFVLRVEWKVDAQGYNAGLFLRAPRENRRSRMGFEVQMFGDYGEAPHKEGTGAIYDVIAPTSNASKPAGEWNTYEITAKGSRVIVVLNGVQVQDVDFNDHEALRYRKRAGYIGLQDHTNPCAYRNVRIKPL